MQEQEAVAPGLVYHKNYSLILMLILLLQVVVRRHALHRAHVVHAVGELDQDDAHIARHRQQHLVEGFGLRFLAVEELQLVELGQAVDDGRRWLRRSAHHLRLGDAAVLHVSCISAAGDGLHVELPVGAQGRPPRWGAM